MRGLKNFSILLVALLATGGGLFAQTGPYIQPLPYKHYSLPWQINVGNGVLKRTDTSAYLEIGPFTGATKGMLPPRLTTAERNSIPVPKDGLFLFNKSTRYLTYYDSLCPCWREVGYVDVVVNNTWKTNGGNDFSTSSFDPVLGTIDSTDLRIKTRDTIRLIVPAEGILNDDEDSNYVVVFEPVSKKIRYRAGNTFGGGGVWGTITGNVIDQADMYDSLLARLLISDTAGMLAPYVRNSRVLAAGYGLSGGGDLSADRAFALDSGLLFPQIRATIPKFAVTNQDWRATADRLFSGANTYNFTFDSLNLFVKGVHGTGQAVPNYDGTVMWFNPLKSAFRAGYNNVNGWYNTSVGNYSAAFGYNTTASGTAAAAFGYGTLASGTYAFGAGYAAIASGDWAVALGGLSSVASAGEAVSIGGSVASYLYAISIGKGNTTSSLGAVTVGFSSRTGGDYAASIGNNLINKWYSSFIVGAFNDTSHIGDPVTWDADNPAFAVGIGTANNARANAITVLQDGKTGIGVVTPTATLHVLADDEGVRLDMPSAATGYVLTATDADGNSEWQPATGGGGSTNSNIGSGFRWAVPGTNNIKTFFQGFGLDLDSTTNADAITIKADTAELATTHALNDSIDALGTLIIETDVGVPMATASGIDVVVKSLLDGANIDVVNTSDTTATINITGTIPIANGGTNTTATPTDGGIVFGNGAAQEYTAVGVQGQSLRSNGTAAPTWSYDTTAIASFGGGSGAAGDTTIFTTSALYGSFFNSSYDTIILTRAQVGLQGTSPSVTVTIYWNDSIAVTAGATKAVNAGNSCTNIYTGTSITSFDNVKIPPGVWVWVQTTTVTTKPKYLSLTLIGYRKKV